MPTRQCSPHGWVSTTPAALIRLLLLPLLLQGPVLVRGLGRYMELKEMAKRQAEQKAAVEAKVFMTNIYSKPASRPFTVPQPFRLGRSAESEQQEEQRRAQVEAAAQQYANRECTFKPQINSSHQTRQQRVQKLLELRSSVGR